ncbi:ABC transporter [Streptomyces griseocarneus]|nr:ABC transporter [Streptomyces griseocarneus]
MRAEPAPVRGELRAARVVWQRELIRFLRNRGRLAMTLLQPVLYLLVLGTGMSGLSTASTGFRTYLFPGVLLMTVQTGAVSAGVSLVWDREMGFLREMLVAPVRRGTLLLGKCAGGATVATCQGAVVLGLAAAAGVPYDPALLATLVGELAVAALALTAFTSVAAVCLTRLQTFQAVMGFALTPMLFLSGALFPLSGLPSWLGAVCLADPLTYAVDLLRHTVTQYAPAHSATAPLTAWPLGPRPSPALELTALTTLGALSLTLATHRFARPK